MEFFELRYDTSTCRPKMTVEEVSEVMGISDRRARVYQQRIKEKLSL